MIINHHSYIQWDKNRWPNFHPSEYNLHCPCCGEFYYDPDAFDLLQSVRRETGRIVLINSAHRCIIHNSHVGGAALSRHKKIAFDIGLRGHDPKTLLQACVKAGFNAFGFYGTFLHTDNRPWRARWKTKAGEIKWDGIWQGFYSSSFFR